MQKCESETKIFNIVWSFEKIKSNFVDINMPVDDLAFLGAGASSGKLMAGFRS